MFACFSYGCAVRGHVAHSKRSALRSVTHCSRHRLVTQHTHTHAHTPEPHCVKKKRKDLMYVSPDASYSLHPQQITPLRLPFLPPPTTFNHLLSFVHLPPPPPSFIVFAPFPLFGSASQAIDDRFRDAGERFRCLNSSPKHAQLKLPFRFSTYRHFRLD